MTTAESTTAQSFPGLPITPAETPLSGTHAWLTENPHPGFAASVTAGYRWLLAGNLLNAQGNRDCLCESGVRSRSWNMYGYTWNNPLAYIDPSGLCTVINGQYVEDGGQPCPQQPSSSITVNGSGSSIGVVALSPGCYEIFIDGFDSGSSCGGGGGTPTTGGGGGGSGKTPTFIRMPLPPNAQACSTNTGVNFNAPPRFSVSDIAANGAKNGLIGAGAAVAQGGYYDFQRFQVGSITLFFPGYTPVANVAVGAYLQGTGAPQWMASLISNSYASIKSSNGATAQQAQFRNLGFSLASGKGTYSCHPQNH